MSRADASLASASIQLAMVQHSPAGSVDAALAQALDWCREAARQSADLVLFPELWTIGYEPSRMVAAEALTRDDPRWHAFAALAAAERMAIAITYLANEQGRLYNRLALFGPDGQVQLEYDKVQICAFDDGTECGLSAGDAFPVAELALRGGTLRVGAMICFDREFPECARALAAQGAELLLVPNACPMVEDAVLGDVRFQQLRARAFENMLAVALCNYPAPAQDGHSALIQATGRVVGQGGQEAGLLMVSLDLAALRQFRRGEAAVWGSANVRPVSA